MKIVEWDKAMLHQKVYILCKVCVLIQTIQKAYRDQWSMKQFLTYQLAVEEEAFKNQIGFKMSKWGCSEIDKTRNR